MARSLVIVESPAKAKTINKYLGRNYTVKASYGHVMDLPKKTIGILLPEQPESSKKKKAKGKGKGKAEAEAKPSKKKKVVRTVPIDSEEAFDPTYEVIPSKFKVVSDLRKAAQGADAIYLAGDPDREGEAICAHLAEILSRPLKKSQVTELESHTESEKPEGKPKKAKKGSTDERFELAAPVSKQKIFRVMFNEITQKAVKAAFEHPTQVNENLVDAQQARRVLDRLVGYKVSPILWDKVRRGLSAGRVQTVALRLIVEREREIRAFVPKEYWTIHALIAAGEPPAFEAKLIKYKGEDLEIPEGA